MFQFNDGKTIKFNRAFLAAESDVLHKKFMESSRGEMIEITDCDYTTFKLFLDCLTGFQKCSVLDALLIFPIAWKYQTNKFIKKCVNILKPTCLDENACLTLNLAAFCKCDALMDEMIDFLNVNKPIYKILDDKKYLYLLEPESMAILLKDLKMDSCVLKNIFEWADYYLKKTNKNTDLKDFFKEHKIIDKLTLSCFETSESLFDFMESSIGEDLFNLSDCWNHIKKIGHDHKKCKWEQVKIQENEVGKRIKEVFEIYNVPFLEDHVTVIRIKRNPVVFYDYPEEDPDYNPDEDEDDSEEEEEPMEIVEENSSSEEENEDNTSNNRSGHSSNVKEDMLKWSVGWTLSSGKIEPDLKVDPDKNLFFENESADFSGRQEAVFFIDHKKNGLMDIVLDVNYDFYFDCRVLTTTMEPTFYPIRSLRNDLHFTYSIYVSHSTHGLLEINE